MRKPMIFAVLLAGALFAAGASHAFWWEFSWADDPGAPQEKVCRRYMENVIKAANINSELKCGFAGPTFANPMSAYNVCMSLSYAGALSGPASEARDADKCSLCRQAQNKFKETIKKAAAWDCVYAKMPASGGGYVFSRFFDSLSVAPSEEGFHNFCMGQISSSNGYTVGADFYAVAVNACIQQKQQQIAMQHTTAAYTQGGDTNRRRVARRAASSSASFTLASLSDGDTENIARLFLPSQKNNVLFEACGGKLGICNPGSVSTSIALATSNETVRDSIAWRFFGGQRGDSSVPTAALAMPSKVGNPVAKPSPVRVVPAPKSARAIDRKDDEPKKILPKQIKPSVEPKPAKEAPKEAAKVNRPPSGGLLDDDAGGGGTRGPAATGGGSGRAGSGTGGGGTGGGVRWRP